ncbi:MAG: type III-B CRISPR module RAMP protein Cmr4 [Desulfobulbaceae bacterium]|nr:type III-B CRISPR module RAMP protein Cmr4 [Desulfobulbaceae bacterium]
MENIVVGMFAETFIHPGSGQNDGVIDQPVARERVTGYPFIAGSSLKGAWLDYTRQNGADENRCNQLFGNKDSAGRLLISDARLLLLPIRSLSRSYCWLTCPLILERLARDLARACGETDCMTDIQVKKGKFYGLSKSEQTLFLEERNFQHAGGVPADVLDVLGKLIPHEKSRQRLADQLVVVSDGAFQWFAENGLSILARNSLDKDKQSKNLWYEETLPPDSLMTSIVAQRDSDNDSLKIFQQMLRERNYLQVGGNETIGQGWFQLGIYPIDGATTVQGGGENG